MVLEERARLFQVASTSRSNCPALPGCGHDRPLQQHAPAAACGKLTPLCKSMPRQQQPYVRTCNRWVSLISSSMKPRPEGKSAVPSDSVVSPTASVGSCCCSCRLPHPTRPPPPAAAAAAPLNSAMLPHEAVSQKLLLPTNRSVDDAPGGSMLQRSRLRRMLDWREAFALLLL